MDLNQVSVFIKVIQEGSFSAAAKKLGMPNSTVSAKVSALESDLGVTLIQRTTRHLNVTPAGEAFFQRCLAGLTAISNAKEELAAMQKEPQGLLRVTAPVELGQEVLPELVMDYQKKFPKVQVEFYLSDRRVDLLAENIDIALRAGPMKDSTLMAKKVGDVYFTPFASAKFIKQHGQPLHPRDMSKFNCIQFTPMGFESWLLVGPSGKLSVPIKSNLIVNDLKIVRSMVLEGAGIALLPNYFCQKEVKTGQLQRLLTQWKSEPVPVHFVYPGQKYASPKVTQFIKLGTEKIASKLK